MRSLKARPVAREKSIRKSPRADAFHSGEGFIEGCRKDPQTVHADWTPAQEQIDGVRVYEVRNVTKGRGQLTEIFRSDWDLDGGEIDQIFQVLLDGGEVSAWHVHRVTMDRLFVNLGAVRIVLYDARSDSPTFGLVNEYRFGLHRPALLVIPAGIWHGLQNLRNTPSTVLNMVDMAYSYENPDQWRLPWDSAEIPYRFMTADTGMPL